ncbi:F-box only protein 47-like [Gigantopelta aegis]|uniref:F-box only protein 47-like n=1 Tax=Gigantopelta aegis TaxID=1735272 RepID=UPI001B88C041|nr:F-box only protein 47-like [Gigantopelta aegis]
MDIKAYLTCKKPRRSNRLVEREKENKTHKTIKYGPLGVFDVLPIELKFHILKYLSIEELSILTIASKAMRNLVEGYRVTRPIGRHLIPTPHPHIQLPQEKHMEYFKQYQRLGLLMKRSTCLYATKDRLKLVNDFLTMIMCCNSNVCVSPEKCLALSCFGKFMHTVIAGWDDSECQRAFDAICQHTSILKNMKIVINSKPGIHGKLERETRQFFRKVFLDHCPTVQDRAFWLSRILKPWPMVHQAKILYLLYGASFDTGDILWYEMCESTPANSEESVKYFGDIANAIQTLHSQTKEWSEDDIISVVDELTSLPEEWLAENVSHLLLMCGDSITSKLMTSKAINGRTVELCSITTSFCLVCVKNNFSLNYVVTLIQNIIQVMENPKERIHFINSMMDMFKELILDIHEFSESDETHEGELFFLVSALSEFTKRLIQVAFKNFLV